MAYMSRIATNALLGGGVRVRVWIREQRKIKGKSKALISLCWQSWTSLSNGGKGVAKVSPDFGNNYYAKHNN